MAIRPFVDGNGRTARLVLNLLLFQHGFPSAVILHANRRQYYRVLAQADAGKLAPLANLVGRAVDQSLGLSLGAAVAQPARAARSEQWLPLAQAAQGTPHSQGYLSLLAWRGRIEATKRGRVWYTTQRAVEAYRRSVEKQKNT